MTASSFSTSIAVAEEAFAITSGDMVRGGLGKGDVYHHHCGTCLSWVYTSFPPGLGFVNVRATLLDDPSWHAPWLEVETRSKLPWAHTGAERSFESSPPAEEYVGFITEYRSARGIA